MKYYTASITNDFKNSSKRKIFKAKFFIAQYPQSKSHKIIIDREDDRRLTLIFTDDEFNELKQFFINN